MISFAKRPVLLDRQLDAVSFRPSAPSPRGFTLRFRRHLEIEFAA